MATHRPAAAAAAFVLTTALAACTIPTSQTDPSGSEATAARPTDTPASTSRTASSSRSSSRSSSGGLVVTGRGWGNGGITGPVPGERACRYRRVPRSRDLLPDPRCTPGAVDRAVTQANLDHTVCRAGGYTSSVRPPDELTEPLKLRIMAAYGVGNDNPRNYELDHVVPLEAGGSSDTRNLYPEPNRDDDAAPRSAFVHNDKDQVEAEVREQLCYHHANLRNLQRRIARNWVRLENQLD